MQAESMSGCREADSGIAPPPLKNQHVLTHGLILCGFALIAFGCGPGGPPVYPVSGTVTIAGKPAGSVQVSLMPIAGSQQVAAGVTDAAGNYRLTWGSTPRLGAEAGRYKVVLNQLSSETEAEAMDRYSGGGRKSPKEPKPAFPKEYSSAETSPKEVEVTSGENTINIEI